MKIADIQKSIPAEVLMHFLKTPSLPAVTGDMTVVAIDIGYGYTKYSTGVGKDGKVKCDLFPSIAPISPQEDLSGGFFVSRNTKKIESGGTVWEVGPDVYEIITKNDVRALHDEFVKSEQWKILLYGALAYVGKKNVDILVLGLPVSHMRKAEEVRKMVLGSHTIQNQEYQIKDVLVVPQPLGALYNYAIQGGNFARFAQTNTLIVDPGYLTFDFLVTKGFAVNAHRSGARPGGMSSILNAIATSIAKSLDMEYDDTNQIDSALNLKEYSGPKDTRPVFIYGKEVELNEHIRATMPVIETSLNFMLNKISDSKDIAQIIMAGGPNKIFERSIRKQFPHHQVTTLEEGIFGNVVGFHLWGMMTAYGMLLKNNDKASLVE